MGQYDLMSVGEDGLDGDDLDGDDLEGDDLMLGADVVLGGARRRRGRGKSRIKLARIQPTAQTQVLDFPLGLDGVAVAASATETLQVRPQRVFQTERFAVASTVAPNFLIGDLVIGRDSMKVANGGFTAAEVFSQAGVGVALRGFIARPGIDIAVTVKNLVATAQPFYGSIIGPCLV